MNIARHRRGGASPVSRWWPASLAIVIAAATAVVLPLERVTTARADEITASAGTLRDGWDPHEPNLGPVSSGGVVGGPSFGQLFRTPVKGQVYAQPLVAAGALIVATEDNWVYSLNAASGAVNWSIQLGAPWPAASVGCGNISPNVGVTSTPVYDPATQAVYLVAQVNDGPTVYQPHFYMFAIAANTGSVLWKTPIGGAPQNDPSRPFNAFTQLQRPALLLLNGWVYAAFGSHCDFTPYSGYVAGVNTSTRALTLWTDEAGVTNSMAGIWHSGGGLVSDGPGRIIFTSGNGVSPAPGPGSSPPGQLAESVVRLGVQADGSLLPQDFFSPANAPTLDAHDQDLGSAAPVALPFGTSTYPHLLFQGGKDGRVFLLNRDNLGGRETGPNHTDNVVGRAGPFQGMWGHPAAFGGSGGADYVYYVGTGEGSGSGDYLRALRFDASDPAHPVLKDVANSAGKFGYSSGSPVVTSNGTNPASAIVWEVYAADQHGTNGQLEAFAAVPQTVGGTPQMKQIWSAPIGTSSSFSIPATDSGRVYVGTRDGHVIGFGSPFKAPLGGSPVSFPRVAVGSSGNATATVTATTGVTVSGVTTSAASAQNPFAVGAPIQLNGATVALPQTLKTGDKLAIPVSFTPGAPGGVTGSLVLATDAPNFPEVSVGLSGDGTRPGFYASPAALDFGTVPTGTSLSLNVDITNGGTAGETVSSVSPPSGPFTVTGLPSGSVSPGGSVTATVTYKPAAAGSDSSSFTINAGDGTSLTVGLSATAVTGQGTLSAAATSVDFGSVALGQSATQTIDISNTGNLPLTITSTAAPGVPFTSRAAVAAGLPLGPGYDVQVPVAFTPTGAGPASGTYRFTAADGVGPPQTVTVTLTGNGTAPASGVAVPPPGGGWTLNGSARVSGTATVLTPAAKAQTGSAVYGTPVPSDGLHVHFTAQIGGGTGADGLTFGLLDAATASARSIGTAGGGLGFAGLPGVAVTLDTYKHAGDPSNNFAGIATSTAGATSLKFVATSTSIGNLRTGTHTVDVTVSGGVLTVAVDGTQVLAPPAGALTLPSSVLPAFTAATGGLTDVHTVRGVTITPSSGPLPPPGGGWSFNGSAAMSGSDTALTRAVTNQAGSVVYPTPVVTNGLQVEFDAQIGGGTGADGLTFGLLDPARARASSLGGVGGGLGFAGLPGIAVTLDTYKQTGYPSNNFAGIATGSKNGLLTYQVTARGIPHLRTGIHTVLVGVSGGVLTVWLDGAIVLQHKETLPAASLLAFTGGTSSVTDAHTVRNVAISGSFFTLTPPGGAGWTYNGAAKMSGTSLVLTPAVQHTHGSAFNTTSVPSAGLHARFTATIGGGTGADGLTLGLLDASKAGAGSIGIGGGGLGFAGLPGVAVTLDTYKHAGDPSNNFLGIATSTIGATSLKFAATTTSIGNLRSGSHVVDVKADAAGQVTVAFDGTQVLTATVAVPQTVLVGFTAGTGGLDDVHTVTNAVIIP
jgi:Bacterial lectin/Abnormal spindle-like microcephaly-assoc'd, ASPM-SPD-2-Hydin/PQQ-like domain